MRRRSAVTEPIQRQAGAIVAGDQVRFLQPRTDGAERYVVGRVDHAFSPMWGAVTFRIEGELWNVPVAHMVEVL